MLRFLQGQGLSFKKISFHKGKSLFVIIPIAVMFGVIVFAASEAKNIITVAHNAIFSPIQGQNEVLEVNKSSNGVRAVDLLNSSSSSTGYTATDASTITKISGVEKADVVSTLPIDIIKVPDLFSNKTFTIDSLAGLDPQYASLYTNQSFNYTEGQPIPIILNANDFVEVYQDWQGKTEITIDFSSQNTPSTQIQGPVKARAISYNRDELIGKTFTIQFGGLEDISPYTQSATSSGFKYTKKSDKDIASEISARKTAISKYWNYTKISTPLTYTFVVAGISQGTDKTTAYIPSTFATKLMKDYLTNATDAKNKTSIPSSDQNVTYTGLVYDGVTLQSDETTTLFAGLRNSVTSQVKDQFTNINKQIASQNEKISGANRQMREFFRSAGGPPTGGKGGSTSSSGKTITIGKIGSLDSGNIKINFPGSTTSYAIPGLVYQKSRTSNTITGVYKSFDFTKSLPLVSNTILVKLASIDTRDTVVSERNTKGYNYQDFSQFKQFNKLESYIGVILEVASGVFMAITALFVLINMAKFVSEGRREIGIFRAIGATKGDIRKLFVLQSLSYILLSILVGGIIGVIGVLSTGSTMVQSAQQFITSTLGSSIVLSGNISRADFVGMDWQMIGLYTGALVLVTLVISLIPAGQAAKVSPVEAIRNN